MALKPCKECKEVSVKAKTCLIAGLKIPPLAQLKTP